MVPRYYFIVNPHSAGGNTAKIWPRVKEAFELKLGKLDFSFTKGNIHATYIAGKALYDGYDAIIAVGGDGTLNEVLNGFYDSDKKINHEACLGYFPSGTGEDLSRTLGIDDLSVEEQVNRLLNNDIKKIDAGMAIFRKKNGSFTSRRFINESSIGFSSDVAERVNRSPKVFRGKAAFILGILSSLIFLKNHKITVNVDGHGFFEGPVLAGVAANGKFFGGGMMIAPNAAIDDGSFDIVIVEGMSRIEVLRNIGSIYGGHHLSNKKVIIKRGKEIRITSKEEVFIEMDGEPVGCLDVILRLLEKEVNFIL